MYDLAISGGAAKGAYYPRALARIFRRFGLPTRVFGVSSGAYTALAVSVHGWEAPDVLEGAWETIDEVRDFQRVDLDPWNGAQHLRPLRRLMRNHGLRGLRQIPVTVGLTNLEAGTYRNVRLNDRMSDERVEDWVIASCTQPGIHERIEIDGVWWADGGVRHTVPIWGRGTRRLVVLQAFPWEVTAPRKAHGQLRRAWEQGFRGVGLQGLAVLRNDVRRIKKASARRPVSVYAPPTWDSIGEPFEVSAAWTLERLVLGDIVQPIDLEGPRG